MKVQWQLKAPEIDNLYDYLAGNMADPPAVGNPRMPRFALDEHQLRAIVTALLAEPQAGAVRLPPLRPTRPQDLQPLKSDWQAYWAYPVPPQGSGDHRLSGLERELRPESCAVCHRQQYAEWQGTRHSLAMGPGIVGQIVDMDSAGYSSCLKCHAVLSEQQHVRRLEGDWQDNPDYQDSLYLSGISCASCHLRAHTRFAAQNTQQKYPWDPEGLTAHPLERTGLLESSDFCWNCHQFAEDRTIADGNPPLQNTNVEHRNWQAATGDPRSCQDCHMPEGRHTFQGIHSAQYVRESLDLQAELTDGPDGPIARLTIGTQEVGHYFPTYVTPAVFVEMELLDAAGRPIEGSFQQQRIQRDARTRDDGNGQREWYDESDTRLPPGSITDIDFGISQADYPEARQVRLELRVEPDYFYHHAYGRWIKDGSRSEQGRDMLTQAMRETGRESSGYTLYEARLDLD